MMQKDIVQAIQDNDIESVRQLIQSGVNLNKVRIHKNSLLHYSACEGYLEITKLLIESGVNVNPRNLYGNTPLHLAACNNCLGVAKLLIKSGADVGIVNYNGQTHIQLAKEYSHLDYFKRIEKFMEKPMKESAASQKVKTGLSM